MYENNNNYSQQSNNSGSTGNGYPEYYYSTGAPNINYEQTQRPPVNAPKSNPKRQTVLAKKQFPLSVLAWYLVFLLAQLSAFLHRLPQKS